MSVLSFLWLVISFYFTCVAGSEKKVPQSRLENLHNPIYQLIFDFIDFDFESMTPNFVNLQLLNKKMNQKIHQAVQIHYQNVKDDIQLFCTTNNIIIPPDLFSTILSSNNRLDMDDMSCKRKRTRNNQRIDDIIGQSNFVKHLIHHFSTVLRSAFQQNNYYLDAFKFYHELFKRKNELPVHINRLLVFAIANSFHHQQRRQIFHDNQLIRQTSNSWEKDNFTYDFQDNKLCVTKYTFELTSFHTYTTNIQLPLFFICSSTNPTQNEEIFCLKKVQVLVKLDNKKICLIFNKGNTDYHIVYRPEQKFIGYSQNEDTVEPCFNLKHFV